MVDVWVGNNREREATPMIIAGQCCGGRRLQKRSQEKKGQGKQAAGPLACGGGRSSVCRGRQK